MNHTAAQEQLQQEETLLAGFFGTSPSIQEASSVLTDRVILLL